MSKRAEQEKKGGFPPGFFFGATLSACNKVTRTAAQVGTKIRTAKRRNFFAENAVDKSVFGEKLTEDIDLARKFGLNSLHVCLPWYVLHSEKDRLDEGVAGTFQQAISHLREHGLKVILTLADAGQAPDWFMESGGWRNVENAIRFTRYAEEMVKHFSPACTHWVPLANTGWMVRDAAAGERSPWVNPGSLGATRREMYTAIVRCCDILREADENAKIGTHAELNLCVPHDKRSTWDLRAARRLQKLLNKRCKESSFDFLALSLGNRYETKFSLARFASRFAYATPCFDVLHNEKDAVDAAALLEKTLRTYQDESLPLYITGCGFACAEDTVRWRMIVEALGVINRAREAGADVQGFFVDALRDDPREVESTGRRRGLVHVDSATGARTPNPSAFAYGEVAQRGGLSAAMRKRLGL